MLHAEKKWRACLVVGVIKGSCHGLVILLHVKVGLAQDVLQQVIGHLTARCILDARQPTKAMPPSYVLTDQPGALPAAAAVTCSGNILNKREDVKAVYKACSPSTGSRTPSWVRGLQDRQQGLKHPWCDKCSSHGPLTWSGALCACGL